MDTSPPFVAIVDDEEAVRRALLRLMRSVGVPARAYASGAAFLADLATYRPRCAVLDLHMPGMSGLAVQASLAALAPEVGVIIMTGQHSAEVEAEAQPHAPLAYLLKPMNDQLLLDALASACAAWRQP
ncbi:response regulator [Rugamonas sp.]|uniref:response regulator transcription factor n=1 Tax=Rugamonas sp. TaxID=1926287 RepID=UPI0025D35256|nr:response regulator [Rugamonas sp.]